MRKNARPQCTVDGCLRLNKTHGLCSLHWDRFRKYGDVHYYEPEYRYHRSYVKGGEDECWPWTKGLTKSGYGKFKAKGKTWIASRYGWFLFHGVELPPHICVCHTCDNPPCQNPKHWFAGTQQENTQDKMNKGRHRANPYKGSNGKFTTKENQ